MHEKLLPVLKLHNLSNEQYERELMAGRVEEDSFYLTPEEAIAPSDLAAGNEHEGKFLRVVNGVAAWVAVPSAEGGSF